MNFIVNLLKYIVTASAEQITQRVISLGVQKLTTGFRNDRIKGSLIGDQTENFESSGDIDEMFGEEDFDSVAQLGDDNLEEFDHDFDLEFSDLDTTDIDHFEPEDDFDIPSSLGNLNTPRLSDSSPDESDDIHQPVAPTLHVPDHPFTFALQDDEMS
jgi:hypothetical protein